MRTRIVQLATPRRILATECCAAALGALAAVAVLGPTAVALGLVAVCALTTIPAVVAIDQLEKRRSR